MNRENLFHKKECRLHRAKWVQNTSSQEFGLQFIIFRIKKGNDFSDGMVCSMDHRLVGLSLLGQSLSHLSWGP